MTALELALSSGQYRTEELPWTSINFSQPYNDNLVGCRQFLLSILLRALFDATMYPEDDERAVSAKRWLEGQGTFLLGPDDILELVGYANISSVLDKFSQDNECEYKDIIRKMKGHLYSRGKECS